MKVSFIAFSYLCQWLALVKRIHFQEVEVFTYIALISLLYRYTDFSMNVPDILRYIGLFMYSFFSLSYVISKRRL